MTEPWEMCQIGYDYIHIYNPKGLTYFKHSEFLIKYDPSFVSSGNDDLDRISVICKLLAMGWEPYAVAGDEVRLNHLFRRKCQD